MSTDEKITILRNALAQARPFVAAASDSDRPTSRSNKARSAVAVVDDALIRTDPDPEVQAILNR